ncbi:MAG: TauD/TfdA family dioxygenase [Ornithinimicrobium sp.]
MRVEELTPLGARVSGLDLAEGGTLDDESISRLRELLGEHGVLAIPGQSLDDAQFTVFLRRFGDLTFTQGETPVPGHQDLNVISNVGRTSPPRSSFHVDTSYVSKPPSYTALRAVAIPEQGGQTLFTDQYRAYETLPEGVREQLAGRTITHVVTGVDVEADDEKSAEHPIFRAHPVTGRTSLFLTTPARCASISGMAQDEAADSIAFLYEHSTRSENTYRHQWAAGDVVIWDNGCVLHCADHSGVVGDRIMHRGMVSSSGYDSDVAPVAS